MTDQSPLQDEIKRLIKSTGPMPVWRYMQLCLTHPQHGYYISRDPLGREGDFTTSPEVSQMFGELLGLWSASVWRAIGAPPFVHLIELAGTLGLTPLVEAHTADEVERALAAGTRLLGVNNRNLQTLEVDLHQFGRLVELIPADVVKVAESGILTTADVRVVADAGADVILVGEALVKHGDPQRAVQDFLAAGS